MPVLVAFWMFSSELFGFIEISRRKKFETNKYARLNESVMSHFTADDSNRSASMYTYTRQCQGFVSRRPAASKKREFEGGI